MDLLPKLRRGVVTRSAGEMQTLAANLAGVLPPDIALALHGDLGAGKTTFVQGLARGFGVAEPVTSPTFNIYTVHRGPARLLVHLDAYRLERSAEVENLLIEDFLVSPWCLAIEWPDNISDWVPPAAWHLDLAITDDRRHSIRLRQP